MKKYCENPEEMVRQLLKSLVGDHALKFKRPRSHGKSKFDPIVSKIMAALDGRNLINL